MGRIALLALALAGSVRIAAAQAPPVAIAILPFTDGGSYGQDRESFEALAVAIPALMARALASSSIQLVPRETVIDAMPASERRLDIAETAELGRQLRVRYVITGAFIDHYGRFRIDARVVDAERRAIVGVVSNAPALQDRRQLFEMIGSVASGLGQQLGVPAPDSPRHVVPSDAITLYGRGLRLADRNLPDSARVLYRRALQADSEFAAARESLSSTGQH